MIGAVTVGDVRESFVIARGETVTTPWTLAVDWDAAPGARQAVVDDASFDLDVADANALPTEPFQPTVSPVGGQSVWDLGVPSGLRVRTLALGLTDGAGQDVKDVPGGSRLTVSLPDPRGGFGAPTYAVPDVGAHGMHPASLTGASFTNAVLTLPDVLAGRLRLAITSDDPAELAPRTEFALGKVSGAGVRHASQLQLADAAGSVLWANPQELTASLHVDVKAGLQKALRDALAAHPDAPVAVSFVLSSAAPSTLSVSGLSIRGALVRAFPGVVRTVVQGEPTPLALPLKPGDPSLALDATARITADVTLHYDGLRVLPFSDVPPAPGALRGRIVGADAVVRALPPAGLAGQRVARLGVVGFAPEACELSVRLVRPGSGEPLPGDPAVVRLEPSTVPRTVWAVLPQPASPAEPAAVAARATRGRFFWTATDDDQPRVRIAVLDDAPAERHLTFGSRELPDDPATPHRTGVDLTAHFTGPAPVFDSLLFYTVDLSDLTVRYER